MNQNNNSNNKFLFDLNKFDVEKEEEVIVEEEVYVEPPAPTFSEDELEAAKAIAHNQGKAEGQRDERNKREQFLSENLKEISHNFETLFAAEFYREKQYEEESLRLALELLNQLAPSLIVRFGKEELKQTLKTTLEAQADQAEIRIEVHPDYAGDIDQFIENLWFDNDNAPKCKVVANTEIELGGCALSWKDGGMVRDPSRQVNEMKTEIENLLVETALSPSHHQKMQKNDGYKTDNTAKGVTNAQNNDIKESENMKTPEKSAQPIENGEEA